MRLFIGRVATILGVSINLIYHCLLHANACVGEPLLVLTQIDGQPAATATHKIALPIVIEGCVPAGGLVWLALACPRSIETATDAAAAAAHARLSVLFWWTEAASITRHTRSRFDNAGD